MSSFNGFVVPFIFVLIYSSVFSPAYASLCLSRPDPLRMFKPYNGDYDLQDIHYWVSTAFTGVHEYAIGAIWMLMGMLFGLFISCKKCFCSNNNNTNSSHASYIILFSLLLVFILLALVTTGLAFTTNKISVERSKKLKGTLFKAGDDVQHTIGDVTVALQEMETILRPYKRKTCQFLNATTQQLDAGSKKIQSFVYTSRRFTKLAVEILYIVNIAVISADVAIFITALDCCFGSVLLFFHWHPGFVLIILFFWILTSVSWVMTGFDFFFHMFIEDTCAALKDYKDNPQNSSLRSMLSCVDSSSADGILSKIGTQVHKFISELNVKITELRELLLVTGQDLELGIEDICDPFPTGHDYRYNPDSCPKDVVPVGKVPKILSRFTCFGGNTTQSCELNAQFLPESTYKMAWAYSESIQDLINIFPDMERLARCTSVKEAISDMIMHQCKPLKLSATKLWVYMLCLSSLTLILNLFLVAKAYQERGRCFSRCSIIPNS